MHDGQKLKVATDRFLACRLIDVAEETTGQRKVVARRRTTTIRRLTWLTPTSLTGRLSLARYLEESIRPAEMPTTPRWRQ